MRTRGTLPLFPSCCAASPSPPLVVVSKRHCVVSAFSPTLHGQHRGDRCSVPEPSALWTVLRNAADPYRRDLVCVLNSTQPSQQAAGILSRARAASGFEAVRPVTVSQFSEHIRLPHGAEHDRMLATANDDRRGSGRADSVAPCISRLSDIPRGSADSVVFEASVLASYGRNGVAHAITEAHRAMRPSGVFGVIGHAPQLRIIGSASLQRDYADYCQYLNEVTGFQEPDLLLPSPSSSTISSTSADVQDDGGSSGASTDSTSTTAAARPPSSFKDFIRSTTQEGQGEDSSGGSGSSTAQKPLVELDDGTRFGRECACGAFHSLFLPYRSFQRRWFTSCYAMSFEDIVGYLRADPLYQLYMAPRAAASSSTSPIPRVVGAYYQHPDPLQHFAQCLAEELNDVAAQRGGGRAAAHLSPTLECEVDHFVVTADDRPVNQKYVPHVRLASAGSSKSRRRGFGQLSSDSL